MRLFSSAVVLYSQFIEYNLLFWKQPGTWGISMDSIVYIPIGVQELNLMTRNGQLRIHYLETSLGLPSCVSAFPLYCFFIHPLRYTSVCILLPQIPSIYPIQPPPSGTTASISRTHNPPLKCFLFSPLREILWV